MSLSISGEGKVRIGGATHKVVDYDINTEVHDAERSMGAELVHIVTGYADGNEVVWHVYEYPTGSVNLVEYQSNYELISEPEFSVEM